MSVIDTTIWGNEEDWISVVNYDPDVPVKDQVQFTSIDGENSTPIKTYISNGNIGTRQVMDQSLCYGALGNKMPLSNIVNMAGVVGWRTQEDGNTPYRSLVANTREVTNKDERMITNYVLGRYSYARNVQKSRESLYCVSAKGVDRFHSFWHPDSELNNWETWYESDQDYHPILNTRLLGRIPVKNFIACPKVRCIDDVETLNPTVRYIDLIDYVDTESEYNYTNCPYVVSVSLVFYTSTYGVRETDIDRNSVIRLNQLVITSPTNKLENIPYCTYDGWDPEARFDGNAYHYETCFGVHTINNAACMMPIMGLINSPDDVNIKYRSANVKSDRDGNWDIYDVRFDIPVTSPRAETEGSGYALDMYSWAGKQADLYVVEDSDPEHTEIQKYNNSAMYLAWHITSQNVDQFREDVRQATAGFGLFFVEGDSNKNLSLDDPDMFLGILEDGVGNGKYSHGEDNRNQAQWNWDDMHENPYDPSDPPVLDPNTYDGSMDSGTLGLFGTPTPKYNLSTFAYNTLTDKLWDALALIPAGDPLGDYCLDTFLTQNPIDCILSLKFFPVSESLGIGETINVKLGKYDTQIPALAAKNQILYDCGTKMIYPRFGRGSATWLDSMTSITLYLPFCGTVSLDPEKYMGRWVGVEYAIDLNTGNCSAYVYTYTDGYGEKTYTEIANGTCAIDLPVTGIQHITLDSQLYNATEQLKGMRIDHAVKGLNTLLGLTSAPSKGIAGGMAAITSAGGNIYSMLHSEQVAEYNLEHTQLPVKNIGTTGACTGAMMELRPTLIFERPDTSGINDAAFAHTNGYACCISDTIGSFTGYTEFANADLSGFSATATEKTMILNALKAGVIL